MTHVASAPVWCVLLGAVHRCTAVGPGEAQTSCGQEVRGPAVELHVAESAEALQRRLARETSVCAACAAGVSSDV